MAKYRRKEIIEAVAWDGDSTTANRFFGESYGGDWSYAENGSSSIRFNGPERLRLVAKVGDVLVKDDEGFFCYDREYFEATFEPVATEMELATA